MKRAKVDGVEIPAQAVEFEFARLARFYRENGMSPEEIERCKDALEDKALEQAIGAMLIRRRADSIDIKVGGEELDAALEKTVRDAGGRGELLAKLAKSGIGEKELLASLLNGVKMDKVVEQACSGAEEPTEADVAAFYEANKAAYEAAGKGLGDVHDAIRNLLRHNSRGKALDAFVAELRKDARIEYYDD